MKLWHREDDLQAICFCSHLGNMYCVDAKTKEILCLTGGNTYEKQVKWMAESGELGITTPDTKYTSRMSIRLQVPPGSELRVLVRYDVSQEWEEVCAIRGTDLRSFSVPIRPVRCDHMKLRFEGMGEAKIYSLPGSVKNSRHVQGKAVDIITRGVPDEKVEERLSQRKAAGKLRYWYRIGQGAHHMDIE